MKQQSGEEPLHGPLRVPLGQDIGQVKAVSNKRQLPHIRQPKSILFTRRSMLVTNRANGLWRTDG
jgi:hypothetical protein